MDTNGYIKISCPDNCGGEIKISGMTEVEDVNNGEKEFWFIVTKKVLRSYKCDKCGKEINLTRNLKFLLWFRPVLSK